MATGTLDAVREAVAAVVDPEIPVLTIADLGVLRSVESDGDTVVVTITPTYSGCPAMAVIEADVRSAAIKAGASAVHVRSVLSPAWTTDWMSQYGRRKLAEYGIAPPSMVGDIETALCPQCTSSNTATVAEFGSTACKALMVCRSCGEPFDRFKSI